MQDKAERWERDGREIQSDFFFFTGWNEMSNLQGAAEQTVQEITELVSG